MDVDATTPDYATMAAEAERAVASMKDPELRRAAFERILGSMLAQRTHGSQAGGDRNGTGKAVSPRAKSSPREARGPKGHVETLIDEGYFKKQRTIADVKAELAMRGHHIALTSLSGPLQRLTQQRRLRRQKTPATDEGTRSAFVYSNW